MTCAKGEGARETKIDQQERQRRRTQSERDRLEAQKKRSIEWARNFDVLSRAGFATVNTALRAGGMSLILFAQMLEGMVEAMRLGLVDTEGPWMDSLRIMLQDAKYQGEKWQEIEKILSEGIESKDWGQFVEKLRTLSGGIIAESYEESREELEEFFNRLMEEREWRWKQME